jgi:hypothetical protein
MVKYIERKDSDEIWIAGLSDRELKSLIRRYKGFRVMEPPTLNFFDKLQKEFKIRDLKPD